jgi:hypothetical protein
VTPHDGSVATGRRAAVRPREDAVVERLRSLSTAIDGEPDPAFRAATRSRLVAMAAVRSPAPAPAPRSPWHRLLSVRAEDAAPARWRGRLTAGLAAAALAVTAVATLVAVSTGARPGDVLYGLKRGTEQTQLALAGDSRGQTLLDFASTRLTELSHLPDGGNSALAVSTLHTMDQQTAEGAAWLAARAVQTRTDAPVRDLTAWTDGQHADLTALEPRLPTAARDDAAASLDLLSRIDARATALTTALSCPTGPATRGADALGPVPVACTAASPSSGGTGTAGTAPEAGTGTTAVPSTGPTGGTDNGSTTGTGSTTGGSGGTSGSGPVIPGTGSVVPSTTPPPIINLPLPLPVPTLPGSSGTSGGSSGSDSGSGTGSGTSGGGIGVCLPPLVQIGTC